MQRPARKKGSFAGILMGQHGEVSLSDLTLFPSSVQQLSSSFLVGTKVTSWSRNFEMVHLIKQIDQNMSIYIVLIWQGVNAYPPIVYSKFLPVLNDNQIKEISIHTVV